MDKCRSCKEIFPTCKSEDNIETDGYACDYKEDWVDLDDAACDGFKHALDLTGDHALVGRYVAKLEAENAALKTKVYVYEQYEKGDKNHIKRAEELIAKLEVENAELKGVLQKASDFIFEWGTTDGDHHKLWVLDQTLRILLGDDYAKEVEAWERPTSGRDEDEDDGWYEWETGIAP